MACTAPDNFDPIEYINTPRWLTSRLGLSRTRELLARLGNPQNKLHFVHVAGTNGKGSTCAYLASILQAAGLRTGLFTSPYIEHFEERIRVNGQNIPYARLVEVTLAVRAQAEAMAAGDPNEHPTEFELMTAVAFTYFAEEHCDIVVCEVGLGGRLDSTNVIQPPDVAVIARIGLDHTAILGNTLAEIAREKAGIIKPGAHVVTYPQEPEAAAEIKAAAAQAGCRLSTPDFAQLALGPVEFGGEVPLRQFSYGSHGVLKTRLLGAYQPQNAALALTAIDALRECGWEIPETAVRKGVAACTWPGRFEVLPRRSTSSPTIVVDGGHNPQGAQALVQSLTSVFPGQKPVFVVGVMADKDYHTMLETVLALASAVVTTTPHNPRALPAEELAQAARKANSSVPVQAAASYDGALRLACELASSSKLICAFGSLYAIGSIKEALRAAGLL